jgi:hypothetical protein
MTAIFYWYGWFFVRPRRWFFRRILACGSFGLRLVPKREEYWGWRWPNLHWWLFYKTVFKFFKWLYWDGWRPFCDWSGGYRRTYPWIARTIHKIGQTTVGYAISGRECYHCASSDGCQVDLSEDETGTTFILKETWSVGTQDGTDHRFRGITICPKCGYRAEYEDGSL